MAPRFTSINLVIPDVAATARFLDALGIALEDTLPEWEPHHRSLGGEAVATDSAVDVDLDGETFAAWWGGVPRGVSAVLHFSVPDRRDVDETHARALELGADGCKAPWDAFWGSRHSVVLAPGPVAVGFMSPPDPEWTTGPPPVTDFAP